MLEVPEFYVDNTEVTVSPYTMMIKMGVQDKFAPGEKPRPVVIVRFSPGHAKVVTMMLRKALKEQERSSSTVISVNPEILNQMGLSLEDW